MHTNSLLPDISERPRAWSTLEYLVIAFMALTPVVYRSFNLLGLLIMLLAVFVAVKHRRDLPATSRALRWLGYLLAANLLLALVYVAIGRDSFDIAKDPLKLIAMIPVMLAVTITGLRSDRLYLGLAAGMLGAAVVILYQNQVMGLARPGEVYNPNPFSEVVMVSGAMLLTSITLLPGWQKMFALAGALAAFYCVLLSGARGTLLAIVPMLIVAAIALARFRQRDGSPAPALPRKALFAIAGLALVVATGLGYQYGGSMVDRFDTAIEELGAHQQDRSKFSSTGIRLELWYASWLSFKDAPLTGIGSDNRRKYLDELEANGTIFLHNYPWRHNHSDYLDSLQRQGLPGMLIVIGLYGILFSIYWRSLAGSSSREHFVLALGGLLTVTGYATFSLTEVPLRNSLTLVFFGMLNAVLLGLLQRPGAKSV
ncbi:MAG: O-antigen ligase family protein [Gammaproteobacteria bacterium]|nr:O-antigen ligase family protein [Gammaproteobacteria bacterium]